MNEILKKRIEVAANDRYTDNTFAYKGFMDGAEYVLSHQWISVKEALPKEDSSVYMNVYVEVNAGHGIGYCVLIAKYAFGKFSCETKNVKVIGWMPIPKFETK